MELTCAWLTLSPPWVFIQMSPSQCSLPWPRHLKWIPHPPDPLSLIFHKALTTTWHTINVIYLLFVFLSRMNISSLRIRIFAILFSAVSSHLELFLVQSRYTITISWMNEWIGKWISTACPEDGKFRQNSVRIWGRSHLKWKWIEYLQASTTRVGKGTHTQRSRNLTRGIQVVSALWSSGDLFFFMTTTCSGLALHILCPVDPYTQLRTGAKTWR